MILPLVIKNNLKKVRSFNSNEDPNPRSVANGLLSWSWFSHPRRQRFFPFGQIEGKEDLNPQDDKIIIRSQVP